MSRAGPSASAAQVPGHMRPAVLGSWFPTVCAAVACTLPLPLWAQWSNQASVDARVTATDNSSPDATGPARGDVYTSLRPALRVAGRGPNFELALNAAVDLVAYSRGTQPNRALPLFEGGLKSILIDQLMFFDANADVHQTEANAFGPRTDASSASNRRTAASYRLSPYLQRDLTPSMSLLARYDESQAKQSGDDAADLRSHYSLVRLARKPVPLGFLLEVSNLQNDSSGIATSSLRVATAKVGVSATAFDEVVVGVAGGVERTRLLLTDQSDKLYGLNFRWIPSLRTELFANFERRFFGTGGELRFSHRTPFTAFSLRVNREPVTATSSLGVIGAGGDVANFLDAILTRSTPDPVQRAVVVQNLISSRGLQASFPSATDFVASYPQLQTGGTASWVYSGARATMSLSFYQQTLRQLTRDAASALPLTILVADNCQTGAALEVNYRLTPEMSLDSAIRWSRVRGLAATEGQTTRENSISFALVQNLSPRTGMTVGIQHKVVDSNVGLAQPYKPTLVFAGVNHRF